MHNIGCYNNVYLYMSDTMEIIQGIPSETHLFCLNVLGSGSVSESDETISTKDVGTEMGILPARGETGGEAIIPLIMLCMCWTFQGREQVLMAKHLNLRKE